MSTRFTQMHEIIQLTTRYPEGTSCDHSAYDGWLKADSLFIDSLTKVGSLDFAIFGSINTNYWGKGAPIELNKYPYFFSELLQCPLCNALFFYYSEEGGHLPEKRLRKLHKAAIVDPRLSYYLNLAIPHSIDQLHEILSHDLQFPDGYGAHWDALRNTLMHAAALPKFVVIYNYAVFFKNWKEKATPLKEIVEDYNRDFNKRIILEDHNITLI